MQITQLRNATLVVEANGRGVLLDPMLSARGLLPPYRWLTRKRRGNPIVDLPANRDAVLGRVTHGLITHCRRGHLDHLDRAGVEWLTERDIPVFCMPVDASFLEKKGLRTLVLGDEGASDFLGGTITPIRCRHGRGLPGLMMVHGSGYVIRLPNQPSLYLAGDTILTDDVRDCLLEHSPAVSVIPAGGARLDIGGEIIMGQEDALEFGRLCKGIVVTNHLEALDHCPVTRAGLREALVADGLEDRFRIPADGETLVF